MTLTSDDTNSANAAITALNAALATYATKGNPTAKALYGNETILPLIAANAGLAVSLGRTLYAEQLAAAKAALSPFCVNNVEIDRHAYELSGPMQIRGWVNGLATGGAADPVEAESSARLIIALFTRVLAAAA